MKTNQSKFTHLQNRKTRLSTRPRTKLTGRKVVVVVAFAMLLATSGLIVFFNLSDTKNAHASASGDYRSKASGNWNSTSTWQKYNGSSWINATAVPSSTDGVIEILSGHTVTVTANVTVDQMVIDVGGTVVINSSRYLYEANGTGTDLTVNGTLTVNGSGYLTENASSSIVVNGTVTLSSGAIDQITTGATFTINNGGTVINNGATLPTTAGLWIVNSGGTFQHNANGGTLPLATWNTGSICLVSGVTTTAPSNLNQTFSFLTWDCASQTATVNLAGGLTTINGDFTVSNTNTGTLALASAASTLNVGGNYFQTGGTCTLCTGASITSTMNISGDYNQSGGTFSVANGTSSTGNINVSGNWSQTGGTLTVGGNSSTKAQVTFNNSGNQTYTASGATVTGNVDYTVNSGSTLVLGTNVVSGRNFTLSSGGGLSIGSPDGITSSGASGNIQVTGTRSFNTAGDYTYSGSAAQTAGNGLPATVHNLTLNNNSGLTLSGTTSVSNVLALTNGIITTGSNELKITNTSTSSITGYSTTDYVVGNLRRSVSGSGSYDFPLGTAANYELINVTLSSTTGFSSILGTFTNGNPITSLLPLTGLLLNGLSINKALDYGYWTLTPNLLLLTGSYSVTANERGHTSPAGMANYSLLKRSTSLLPWDLLGTHVSAGLSAGAVSAKRSGFTSFSEFAIGYGEAISMTNVSLLSGTDGQVNAIYKFPNACTNVDVWIQLLSLSGGATLSAIDDASSGYDEAWQPFVNAAGNTTSSILWKLMFKVAGTSTDTTMSSVTITGVDVDGDGSSLREFVEATWPYSYSVDPSTTLTITNTGTSYRATSGTAASIANIDTSQRQAMFEITYHNINNFQYRTGAISTKSASEVRQNSLYFKSFSLGNTSLPIELIYFNAKLNEKHVELSWATASEMNNDFFTVERSDDGIHFDEVARKPGAGNSTVTKYYSAVDENPLHGYSYYRLKQTDFNGHYTYSDIKTVKDNSLNGESDLKITSVAPNPFTEKFTVSFLLKTTATVEFQLYNSSGQMVYKSIIKTNDGMNQYDFIDEQGLTPGMYFMNLVYNDQKVTQKIIKR